MDASGWQDGLLLIHIHEKWRAADMAQLECLANGANGIWAALSEDGAALGHASTTLTLMNLIRLGNTKVTEKFNCQKLRESASKVCQISTGSPPNPKMPVYGERALDLVFPFGSIAGGLDDQEELNLSQFFGQAGGATYADKNREILTYLLHLDWDFKCGERRKGEGNIN